MAEQRSTAIGPRMHHVSFTPVGGRSRGSCAVIPATVRRRSPSVTVGRWGTRWRWSHDVGASAGGGRFGVRVAEPTPPSGGVGGG